MNSPTLGDILAVIALAFLLGVAVHYQQVVYLIANIGG